MLRALVRRCTAHSRGFTRRWLSSASSSGSDLSKPPVLRDAQSVYEAASSRTPAALGSSVRAMYSSSLGGIVTDPALMQVPVDDHAWHRGHAVFDTCSVRDGRAYCLDMHIDRLLSSAALSRIDPAPFCAESLKSVVLRTLAVAGRRDDVFCRYWLTAGRGDFAVSPRGCVGGAGFYVVVHDEWPRESDGAVSESVVSTPLKPKLLANMKSNNYMINALTAMAAEDQGGKLGIQLDEDGYLREASISCVAIVDGNGALRTPQFDSILASTTVRRTLDYARVLVGRGVLSAVEQRDVHVDEMRSAREVILLGGHHVTAVGALDGNVIGDGRRGPVCKALQELNEADMENPDFLDEIPFD